MRLSRRQFIGSSALALAAGAIPLCGTCGAFDLFSKKPSGPEDITGTIFRKDAPKTPWKWSVPGRFAQSLPGNAVICGICPNGCILEKGDRSICRSRVNIDGELYSLVYGNPCAVNVDPIEKKPLFHFLPQTRSLSIAGTGCNFRCLNCQNWEISQARPEDVRFVELFPGQVVEKALQENASSIAYTYSEATTAFEYMTDTARLAREKSIKNLWISNGYINPEPLDALCAVIDAANVNLKSFEDATYRKLNGGRLQPVLETFKTLHKNKIHFEMTTLIVPGYVDDPGRIKAMCGWILDHLGPDHPLHLLRFFPRYKLDRLPPTPVAQLARLRETAMESGIHYVYMGNVPGHEGGHTYCHNCRKRIIERTGYRFSAFHIKDNQCEFCGTRIPGVWA